MPASPTISTAGEQTRCPHADFIAYVNTLPDLPPTIKNPQRPHLRYGVLLVRCRQCSATAVLSADEPQEDVGMIYFSYAYPQQKAGEPA